MVVVGNYRNRTELRKKPRRLFHYDAKILVDKSTPLIPCSIGGISASGASLSLEGAEALPDTFVLMLTANGRPGPRRHCRIIWRQEMTVGVEFPQE